MTTRDILGSEFDNFRNLIVSIIPDTDADLNSPIEALMAINSSKELINTAFSQIKYDWNNDIYVSLARVSEVKSQLTSLNYFKEYIQKVLDEEKKEVLEIIKEIENM